MARGTEVCSSLLSIVIKEEKMTESSGKKHNTLDWLLVGECCFGAMAFPKHGSETQEVQRW